MGTAGTGVLARGAGTKCRLERNTFLSCLRALCVDGGAHARATHNAFSLGDYAALVAGAGTRAVLYENTITGAAKTGAQVCDPPFGCAGRYESQTHV